MGFTVVPDKAAGDVFSESMYDTYIKDNLNTGIPVLLASTTLGSAAASIDLNAIPQDWAHLMIVAYMRGDTAATSVGTGMRFNADTGANYDYQYLYGTAATAGAGEAFAQAAISFGSCPAASASSTLFSATVIEIPYYSQSTNNKAATVSTGYKLAASTGNLQVFSLSGFWRSGAAITRVELVPVSGNWATGSRVSLFGMP